MRSEVEANRAIDKYSDTVKRLCMAHLKSASDTEDIFQNVFLKYITKAPEFESEEHEKTWIIRVTINECKDFLKSFFHHRTVSIDELLNLQDNVTDDNRHVLESVLTLPQKYRDVIYLYYYEGYSAVEISKILSKNVNSIYTLISRAKKLLRESLGGDEIE